MRADAKVLVVGAGIGGLAAGAALGRRGIACEVIEVQPASDVYGVGINQPGNALRALDALGVRDEVLSVGYEFGGWDFHGPDGELVVGVDSRLADDRVPHNVGLSRRDLHTILLAATTAAGTEIRYATTLAELHEEPDGAHVRFSDGREERYDLVAAFDGIRSPLRDQLFAGAHRPTYSGVAVWRVTIPRPEHVTRGGVYQGVDAKAGYIPMSEAEMYLFLVTPEPRSARLAPAERPAVLRERLAGFGGLVGEIRDGLADDADVVYSPLDEVLLPAPWGSDRVVVCGDAAHACAPHLTQGAGMALEDAVVLADEVGRADAVPEALRAFSLRRYPRAKFIQDVSRGILQAEMAVTRETLAPALAGMREHLPGQLAHVDELLLQPA